MRARADAVHKDPFLALYGEGAAVREDAGGGLEDARAVVEAPAEVHGERDCERVVQQEEHAWRDEEERQPDDQQEEVEEEEEEVEQQRGDVAVAELELAGGEAREGQLPHACAGAEGVYRTALRMGRKIVGA